MKKSFIALLLIQVTLIFGSVLISTHVCQAQSKGNVASYPSRLPYRFANFVWWSDDELRAALAQRIPGLGDEVATTHAAEGKMRDALTALLKEKGIVAEVQSDEPSPTVFIKSNLPVLLGQKLTEPQPAIIFSIFEPKVLNGKMIFKDVPQELDASLQELQQSSGRPFTEQSNAFTQTRVIEILNQRGYLDGDAKLQRQNPHRDGENWVVDLQLTVKAGPRYRVASIEADGGPLLQGRDLSRFNTLRGGDYAAQPPFGSLGLQLRSLYEQKGFADVDVEVVPTKNPEQARVSYRLFVKPGPVYHLRSLIIEHLNVEQEARVREIFATKAGEVYDGSATNRLNHALPNEPLLHGMGFGFSPMPDRNAAAIDMKLSFYKEGGDATVTIK